MGKKFFSKNKIKSLETNAVAFNVKDPLKEPGRFFKEYYFVSLEYDLNKVDMKSFCLMLHDIMVSCVSNYKKPNKISELLQQATCYGFLVYSGKDKIFYLNTKQRTNFEFFNNGQSEIAKFVINTCVKDNTNGLLKNKTLTYENKPVIDLTKPNQMYIQFKPKYSSFKSRKDGVEKQEIELILTDVVLIEYTEIKDDILEKNKGQAKDKIKDDMEYLDDMFGLSNKAFAEKYENPF